MSDSEDLDEINRQLAELEGELGDEDLDDLDDVELSDEDDLYDGNERLEEVEEEIRTLVQGLTGSDLSAKLRERLTEVLKEKDSVLLEIATKEGEYEQLKAEVLGQKDSRVTDLELEIDLLNDNLEDEERESANMYVVFKQTEAELNIAREEHARRLKAHEKRRDHHKSTMEEIKKAVKQSQERCVVHQKFLMDKVNQLSEDLYKLQMENEELAEENLNKELRVEELLNQQSEKENLAVDESKNVSNLREIQQKELEELNNQLNQLIEDTEKLSESNKKKKTDFDILSKEYREKNRKHNKLTLEYDDASRINSRLDREAERQTNQIERLENEISDLKSQRKEVMAKVTAA